MDFETIKRKITNILKRNDAEFAAVFGSAARGEAKPDSDIDILVRFKKERDEKMSLFDQIGIAQELEDALQKRVDLIPEKSLREFAALNAKKDLIVLYGHVQRPDLL